jgi:hypothetical protein
MKEGIYQPLFRGRGTAQYWNPITTRAHPMAQLSSSTKKHVVLAIVMACSFLPRYGSVTGAATLTLQRESKYTAINLMAL